MKILFLTLLDFNSINERNIYTDLLREFVRNGHHVSVISPIERRSKRKTMLIKEESCDILKLRIGNTQKVNVIEKGISTIAIEPIFIRGIKKYFLKRKFDLILYSTPPITFERVISYVKKRDGAKTYLLLKDIFPQNAVDLGMLSKTGVKGVLYRCFRNKEKRLYAISDKIGCMSQANVNYVLQHNHEISEEKVEICPNSIEVVDMSVSEEEKVKLRKKYQIPLDKKVFVYGGNLGKPQGINFLIKCLKSQEDNEKIFFLIIGAGTEFGKIEKYVAENKPENVKLMRSLPKEDYDKMISSCDVGMIFLDYRFTIPNFPSRLLSYMQAKLPVLAVTDPITDIGEVIVEGSFGWWCESNNTIDFASAIDIALKTDLIGLGNNAFKYLINEYSVKKACEIIFNLIGG